MRQPFRNRVDPSTLSYRVITLRRTVRFAINPGNAEGTADTNGHGGRPALRGWGSPFELTIDCAGEPDLRTGYLINIKDIDDAVRRRVVPVLTELITAGRDPGTSVIMLLREAQAALPVPVRALTLRPTPTLAYEAEAGMAATVVLSQKFEFAAAHRLHSPAMSDAENRSFFGKCNNPAGHGHNYVIQPRVEMNISGHGGSLSLIELERITQSVLIEPFDHKHLNIDTAEFRDGSGVNPTVENIARVFYGLLAPAIEGLGRGARLREITVWETDRTSATYGQPRTS